MRVVDYICSPENKRLYNEQHFTESASRYDIATIGLSLCRDFSWKQQLIDALPALKKPRCLDLACGTGDLSFLLAERYPNGEVLGLDLTAAMLDKAKGRNSYANVSFVKQDMCSMSFPEDSFDIITGSYALRNAPNLESALRNIQRALSPEGVAAFLDFSKPSNSCLQFVQYWLLKVWGSFWGLLLHANPKVHGYISASLKHFPERQTFHNLIESCGFEIAKSQRFFFGIMELIVLKKRE